MFTGIIKEQGKILSSEQKNNDGLILQIEKPDRWQLETGESIACNGVCLTVTDFSKQSFTVFLSQETLNKTTNWQINKILNLERAILASDRLGGHLVSGHVEGTCVIVNKEQFNGSVIFTIKATGFEKFLLPKGSIALDGVSLTIVDTSKTKNGKDINLSNDEFTIWIIPHTINSTNLKFWEIGQLLNIETDQNLRFISYLVDEYLTNQQI